MNDSFAGKNMEIAEYLAGNRYPGRGILLGVTPDGKKAVTVYFIMGRSENSRNRVFVEEDGKLKVLPFDESKLGDPSLVIYTARRQVEGRTAAGGSSEGNAGTCAVRRLIVTNGDQTDTVADAYEKRDEDGTFEAALATRTFEPDPPIYTPRISGMIELCKAEVSYKLSILKKSAGDEAERFYYNYPGIPGVGHLIHTYECGEDPKISFAGEPRQIETRDDMEGFAREVWNALDEDNKVSLFAAFTDIGTGEEETCIINKNG